MIIKKLNSDTYTKDDAISIMQEGHKISHPYFANNEFIYMKGNIIYDENDYHMGYVNDFFNKDRSGVGFLTDWYIVDVFNDEIEENISFKTNGLIYEELHGEGNKPLKRGHYAPIRKDPKVGRNNPCSCGSGKKFKKCCHE